MAQASSGIRRKVDDLGRVVIPAGIRRSLHIREGDALEVSVEGARVVLSKPHEVCVFCGREDAVLTPIRTRLVCAACLAGLQVELTRTSEDAAASATMQPDGATQPDGVQADGMQPDVPADAPVPADYDPASTTAW
jgi:AbrB family transcriptional regulator, transcriptional pleiotropic regulator of transition state genes